MAANILSLPPEMLRNVFLFLDGRSLIACRRVCKYWYTEIDTIPLNWQSFCKSEMRRNIYVDLLIKHDPNAAGLSNEEWKKIYSDWVNPRKMVAGKVRHISYGLPGPSHYHIQGLTTHCNLVFVQFFAEVRNEVLVLMLDGLLEGGFSITLVFSINPPWEEIHPIIKEEDYLLNLIRPARYNIPVGCCHSSHTKYASEYLQREVTRLVLSNCVEHSAFVKANCVPTYYRQHGSLIIVSTNTGDMFFFRETDEGEENELLTVTPTKVENIISIDVAWTPSEFVVVFASVSIVGTVSFPLS